MNLIKSGARCPLSLKTGVAVLPLVIAMVFAPTQAQAQDGPGKTQDLAQTQTPDEKKDGDILVTGTLIRGIAPVGTETVNITPQDIQESGAVTVQDVLAKVPQLGFFNRTSTSGNDMGVGQRLPPQQPMIYGLPSLILLDGRRIASAGAGGGGAATSIDPSIIPTGVLGGIEIVPDGGSALYGSDAVGGVINMTTLKRFDGVKAEGTVSFADAYKAYRGSLTVGKDWGTGSIYASYDYDESNSLLGSDRPFIQQNPAIVTCFPATVTANAQGANPAVQYTYAGTDASGKPTAYVTGPDRCSRYANELVLPSQQMHSVFAGLSQDLSSAISVDLRAFWSQRKSTSYNAFALVGNATFPSTNPFYLITPAQVGTSRTQRVDFSLAPAVGPNLPTSTKLDTWGVSGELKAALVGDFQARLLGNFSESTFNSLAYEGFNTTLLAQAIARTDPATALDLYNPAATPGSTLVAQQIANRPTTAFGRDDQVQARLVTDGTLFHIGGGDVKIAAGGEVIREDFAANSQIVDYLGVLTSPRSAFAGSRTVYSVFGEIEVPLISPESNGPIYALRLSAAGRYDHYSDFGGTFNPRFAASVLPVEWLTFRGTYGTSFVAPSLPQLFAPTTVNLSNTAFILPPGATNILIVTGGNPTLQPQKATTWSLGGDFRAPFMKGLRIGVTYYNANFTNQLATGPFTSVATFYTPTYASFYLANPTLQQAQAFIGGPYTFLGLVGSPTLESGFAADGSRVAGSPNYIVSGRAGNLSAAKTDGLDISVNLTQPVSFGSLEFDVAGNYILNSTSAADGVTFVDQLLTSPRFRGSASAGANIGNFRVTTTLLHTAGYGLPANATTQTRIKAYDTVDAFMSYTFKDMGMLSNTQLSLQVTNLFNVRPPVNLTASSGYAPGSILLRTFQIGLSKKF